MIFLSIEQQFLTRATTRSGTKQQNGNHIYSLVFLFRRTLYLMEVIWVCLGHI
jgi:hypothetical protein